MAQDYISRFTGEKIDELLQLVEDRVDHPIAGSDKPITAGGVKNALNQTAPKDEVTALKTRVETIEDKIPSEASSSNQLADKDFVKELLDEGYLYKGVAVPSTNPGTQNKKVFYLAGQGTYANFGGAVVPEKNIGVLKYNGSWALELIEISPGFSVINDLTTGGADDALSAEMGKHIMQMIRPLLDVEVDTSALTQWHRVILASNKWQSYGTGYLSIDVPIEPGRSYIVTPKTETCVIALLKTDTYATGTYPDYCDGYFGRIVISGEYTFIAPPDARFLYVTILIGNVEKGAHISSDMATSLPEIIEGTKKNIEDTLSEVCVSRIDRRSLNPNGQYNNSYISISRRFSPTHDSLMLFGNKDAASVTNKFFDFFGCYVHERSTDGQIYYPQGVTELGNAIVVASTTDSILPVIVGAVNNIDGDNTSKWFTGQNHAYGNKSSGSSLTMREISCNVLVDNVAVAIGDLGVRGKVCTIEVVNRVQGYNTCKSDGTGREIIEQKITVVVNNDRCRVRVEYKALEDVIFYNIPGVGQYGAANTSRQYRFIGSTSRKGLYDFNGTAQKPSADDRKINCIKVLRDGRSLDIVMRDFGLGNYAYNTTQNNAYSTSANKVYTRLTEDTAEIPLEQGGLLCFEFDYLVNDNAM